VRNPASRPPHQGDRRQYQGDRRDGRHQHGPRPQGPGHR
jgi:hypothetical protein